MICQYRSKRAALDHRNIDKQIARAREALNGQIPASKIKFLCAKAKSKQINQELIGKARACSGIKGSATYLDIPDEDVIAFNHQLFKVEAVFRMAKSNLRPGYLSPQSGHK